MPSEKDIVEGINYKAPQKELWTGRKTNSSIGNQYWYQEIQFFKANSFVKSKRENQTTRCSPTRICL